MAQQVKYVIRSCIVTYQSDPIWLVRGLSDLIRFGIFIKKPSYTQLRTARLLPRLASSFLQVVSALRNCCFDASTDLPAILLSADLLWPALLLPLAGTQVRCCSPHIGQDATPQLSAKYSLRLPATGVWLLQCMKLQCNPVVDPRHVRRDRLPHPPPLLPPASVPSNSASRQRHGHCHADWAMLIGHRVLVDC